MQTIRTMILILFIILMIGSIALSLYLFWLTAFAVGWSGGQINFEELLWMWKGFLLLALYSLIAFIGLRKNKNYGVIFGISIPLTLIVVFVTDLAIPTDNFILARYDVLDLVIFCFTPTLVIWGLIKLKTTNTKFKLFDYVLCLALACFLYLTFSIK